MAEEQRIERKKVKMNGSVSRWADTKARSLVKSEDFGNISNFYETAVIYFLGVKDKEWEAQAIKAEHELVTFKDETKNTIQKLNEEISNLKADLLTNQNILCTILLNHPELSQEITSLGCKVPRKPITLE